MLFQQLADPDHDLGYTETLLRQEFQRLNCDWGNFSQWMDGQTIGLTSNNEPIYYLTDVRRYLTQGGLNAPIVD